ncbi:peptide MFS transporter [Staphylococcus pettenkoferi]|uniref:Peptide MFS transporter n=1 Tax=Staphylococcus pettenkoferi TaxID=170573 RepID=A0ABT4BP75_9STAP|nr:peptide MFS transporter [Staphylococcus pettenkoferi]MCY1571100.1 peptide MFS transporter [Staphylococcus pettenkoferi]MCY1583747.1 peptide MFS transporter [Staphylococcus pettenkoferi]MCY1593209.1 peptide MFS transporter [Staphylococcus pettenkoferi]MCY1599014.1 peptide MFS transporter [Staphylococcus pettenkoferi]MCY1606804.1 peptide MFS transporter [Staphylococcus pettenkoferi]
MNRAQHTREEILNSTPRKGFFGHPKGLSTLFLTEFWERFSYYGMKAILVYYLYYSVSKGGFGLDEGVALQIVSIYGTLIYMSGIIGGWIADRITGTQHAVFYGGFLIMIGHILLSLPNNLTMVMIALLFLICGTGLLKPNISTTVGELYAQNDARRDAAFTIFYMGINSGALLSPLVTGYLQSRFSFHLGFLVAAIGMFCGLVIYVVTRKKYLGLAGLSTPNPLTKQEIKKTSLYAGVVIILIALYLIILQFNNALTLQNFSLFITAVAFWMIQEQGSTVLASFADNKTQLDLGKATNGLIHFHVPAAWFQSFNPIFTVALAPVFAALWVKLGKFNPPTVHKFALGTIVAGLSFIVMYIPLSGPHSLINPLWLILSYLLITIGELCISPVGLSTTTKLSPVSFTARMMSLWLLADATAQGLNAQLVVVYTRISQMDYFLYSGIVAIAIGVILFLLSPLVKKGMKGVF